MPPSPALFFPRNRSFWQFPPEQRPGARCWDVLGRTGKSVWSIALSVYSVMIYLLSILWGGHLFRQPGPQSHWGLSHPHNSNMHTFWVALITIHTYTFNFTELYSSAAGITTCEYTPISPLCLHNMILAIYDVPVHSGNHWVLHSYLHFWSMEVFIVFLTRPRFTTTNIISFP